MDESAYRSDIVENQRQGRRAHEEGRVVPITDKQEPFSGDIIEYKFLEISAKLDVSKPLETWQTTPAEGRGYGHLSTKYDQGYRMLSFVALPVWDFYKLTFDSDDPLRVHKFSKFQGIFRKQLPCEVDKRWGLRVKTCSMTNKLFYNWHRKLDSHFKRVSDCRHILQTIDEISQDHGRVVGLEMVDYAAQQLEIEQYKAWMKPISTGELRQTEVAADIFYEVPLHSSPEKYVYQTIDCSIYASMDERGLSSKFEGWKVSSCNLKETFDDFLGYGWKLVDIFHDNAAEQTFKASGLSEKISLSQNFVGIFEKPKSREKDVTPYFEMRMMEHWLRVPGQGYGYRGSLVNLDEDWTNVITDMGLSGWEVAGIVRTPETSLICDFIRGFQCYTKMLLFFQRPIQPPSYSTLFV